jgi:streptogramin lyase
MGLVSEECAGQVLPVAGGDTLCNGQDDDCDGVGDEELWGPCGDCDLTCFSPGDVVPSPDDPGSSGLAPNPDGPGVVLGTEEVAAGYAWIANAGDGTVSKLDLETGAEVGRYRVGRTGTVADSPSRTAVDGLGNAYVANRAHTDASMNQGSVTKMAGDRRFCVDRDGDTVVETSTGPTPLDVGADECVIWTVDVGGPGAIPRALAIDAGTADALEGFPWVGCWSEMRFYRLHPDTGAVVATVDVNVQPYGAAIDGNGWVWISGMRPVPGYLQRFHVETLVVEDRISAEPSGCGSPSDSIYSPYGITVDPANRVWVGSWSPNVCRWDPVAASWFTVPIPAGGVSRGVAADADGRIWASQYGGAGHNLVVFNGEDGSGMTEYATGGTTPIGVGIDELDHVWTVNQGSNNATRLTKATSVVEQFPVGTAPYTYSDFTGYQRRLLVPRGIWTHDYERCDRTEGDHWGRLSWDVTAPPGEISIFGVSADRPEALDSAETVTLAVIPDDVPPVDLEAAFAAAGVPTGRLLRLTVVLEGDAARGSPVFRSLEVQWHCNELG